MPISQSAVQRSQLGRLLLVRKLITEDQLNEAIRQQQSTGKRLGEVLVEQGWVTQRQIGRALRKQSNIRMVAAILAMLTMPFQLARADDLAPSRDMYNAAQHEVLNTFESQAALTGSSSPDLGDVAGIHQNDGEANLAVILQSGSHDTAMIEQNGGVQNTAAIMQVGSNQSATIAQSGKQNTALVLQR